MDLLTLAPRGVYRFGPVPSLDRFRHTVARVASLLVSVLLLLGHVCGEPVVDYVGVIGAPPNPSHGGGHDGDEAHLASCQAMPSKPIAAPFIPRVGAPVIERATPLVVVAPGLDQVGAVRSRPPLFMLHASFLI